MIAAIQDKLRDAVTAAIGEITGEVTEDRHGCWRVRCADGFQLNVTLDHEWLGLRAPFAQDHIHGQAVTRCAWEVLLRNSLLPGAAKLVTTPNRAVIYAALEFPLDLESTPPAPVAGDASDNTLRSRLSVAIDDLKHATLPHLNCKHRVACPGNKSEFLDLPALCTAAGWPFNRRNECRVTVQLETTHCYAQAVLDCDDGLRATVNLHRSEQSLFASSRQAIAVMLLQVGGLCRAVRPAAQTESGHDALVLQAYLSRNPSPREFHRIVSALSVAAGMCQLEVALLSDERISNRYLSVRGRSATAAKPA
jgi:hypothetical protein